MFFAPNPGVLAAGVSTAKTYPEFLTYITAQAPTLTDWGAFINTATGPIRLWPRAGLPSYMPMYGSPWGPLSPNGVSGSNSAWAGVVWHAMPDLATFNAVRNATNQVLLQVEDGGISSPSYSSYSRNGLTSSSTASTGTYVRRVTEMLFYVPGQGPMRIQPKLGLGPFPFSW